LVVALRTVLADLLAELAVAQEIDELGAQEQADEQRGGATEEDAAHQRPCAAASFSATRSSPTPSSRSTPRSAACRPTSRCSRGESGPSSSMSPSTATRLAGAVPARSSIAARMDIGLAL